MCVACILSQHGSAHRRLTQFHILCLPQTNWFSALFQQLNLMANSGQVPHLKGRNADVFRAVETEFETLYVRHIVGKSLDAGTHRYGRNSGASVTALNTRSLR